MQAIRTAVLDHPAPIFLCNWFNKPVPAKDYMEQELPEEAAAARSPLSADRMPIRRLRRLPNSIGTVQAILLMCFPVRQREQSDAGVRCRRSLEADPLIHQW